MRYRSVERFTKVWQVIDTRGEGDQYAWPFGVAQQQFFHDPIAPSMLSTLLNAARQVVHDDPVEKIGPADVGREYCHYCGEPVESGLLSHHDDCPWMKLKAAL